MSTLDFGNPYGTTIGNPALAYSGACGGYGGNLNFGTLNCACLGGLAGDTTGFLLDSNEQGNGYWSEPWAGGLPGQPPAYDLCLTNSVGTGQPVTLKVGYNGQNTTFYGTITGKGTLVKVGSGTLTLDSYDGCGVGSQYSNNFGSPAGNQHLGGTVIQEGTLAIVTWDNVSWMQGPLTSDLGPGPLTFAGTATTLQLTFPTGYYGNTYTMMGRTVNWYQRESECDRHYRHQR